jgi:putative SOS response-associated peptidase YedK
VCGRVALYSPPSRLARLLSAELAAGLDETFHPSWNLGPARTLFGVREDEAGARTMTPYTWGLIPAWAKDPRIANQTVNARSETVREKPSFREAYRHRPIVVPVDGYFEWEVLPRRTKQPHYFFRRDGEPMIVAGLFEVWHDPLQPAAPARVTCTLLTCEPSSDIDDLHDRMPVILRPDEVSVWLATDRHSPDERYQLLQPAPAGTLVHHPVDQRVGSVRNDGPEMIEPRERHSLF